VTPNDGFTYVNSRITLLFLQRDHKGVLEYLSSPMLKPLESNAFWGPTVLQLRAKAHHYLGQQDEVLRLTKALEDMVGVQMAYRDDAYFAWELLPLAQTHAYAGNLDRALEVAAWITELRSRQQENFDDQLFDVNSAWLNAKAGNTDKALEEIERLLNAPGFLNRKVMALDPDWDFIRDNERFKALISVENGS
jgi:hypothetical protein